MGHMVKYPDLRDGSSLFDFYGNPIASSFPQVFNVLAYKASPGASDNTSQVQAAITAAAAVNGIVWVPGIFKCTGQLTVPAGEACKIAGPTKAGSQLLYTGSTAQPFLIFPGGNQGSSLENISVWGANAAPAVQLLSSQGSGTNGYQSLVTFQNAYIGYVYNGASANISQIGLQAQCDVFRMFDTDVWGSNIAAWYQQGTTDAYLVDCTSSCLPQGRVGDTVKIGTLLEDGSAGTLYFAGTFMAVNCGFAGVAGSTANFANHSIATLVNCYAESGTLPLKVAGGYLEVRGGQWSTNSTDALYILHATGGQGGTFAPTAVAGNAHLTNLVNTSGTDPTAQWNVTLPAEIAGTVPTVPLNIDAPGVVDCPGRQMGFPVNVVHITHAQNGYVAQPGDVVLVDATAGATFVQLPPPATCRAPVTVKKIDASANLVEINHNNTDTIDGANNITWTTQYEAATVASDGTNWFVISQVATTIL